MAENVADIVVYHEASVRFEEKRVKLHRQPPIIPWYPVSLQNTRQSNRFPWIIGYEGDAFISFGCRISTNANNTEDINSIVGLRAIATALFNLLQEREKQNYIN